MKRTGKPSGKVTLLGTYDVDHDNHIVYLLGVDEIGKHYSIEEHEYVKVPGTFTWMAGCLGCNPDFTNIFAPFPGMIFFWK